MPKWWNSMPLYWTRPSEPVCGNVKKCDKCPASTSPQAVWTKNTIGLGSIFARARMSCLFTALTRRCGGGPLPSRPSWTVMDRHEPFPFCGFLQHPSFSVFNTFETTWHYPTPGKRALGPNCSELTHFCLCQKESHPHFVHFINNPSCETWKRWKGPW